MGDTSVYFTVRYDEVVRYGVYRVSVVDKCVWSNGGTMCVWSNGGTMLLTGDGCSMCRKSTAVPLCQPKVPQLLTSIEPGPFTK